MIDSDLEKARPLKLGNLSLQRKFQHCGLFNYKCKSTDRRPILVTPEQLPYLPVLNVALSHQCIRNPRPPPSSLSFFSLIILIITPANVQTLEGARGMGERWWCPRKQTDAIFNITNDSTKAAGNEVNLLMKKMQRGIYHKNPRYVCNNRSSSTSVLKFR